MQVSWPQMTPSCRLNSKRSVPQTVAMLAAKLLPIVFLAFPAITNGARVPSFDDFKDVVPFSGAPAPLDLKSNSGARTYRTRLRDGVAKGPNFAGGFTLVTWNCGEHCEHMAVVSA